MISLSKIFQKLKLDRTEFGTSDVHLKLRVDELE